jgi:hypothetical protein
MAPTDEVNVVPGALHREATKWRSLADQMTVVQGNASRLELGLTAFFFADIVSTTAHAQAYDQFQEWLAGLFGQAAGEFDEIAGALDRAAELYQRTDHGAGVSLREICGNRQ